ncbi:MAG: DUF1800 family protein [Roseibacillus sp.]
MKHTLFTLVFAGFSLAHANIETLFLIGEKDGDHSPFGQETPDTEPAPGSPTELDDHYYVSSGEPASNFERSLTTWDPSNTVHFELTTAQANPDGLLYFDIGFIWSGNLQDETSANTISCRLNGVEFLLTPSFVSYQDFSAEVSSLVGLLQTGANTLEIVRTGGTSDTWLGIDYLQLTVDPTANEDADEDGLPLRWEVLYQLSDDDSSDAGISSDDDLLTNLQEFQAGTNPRSADTDHDALPDHLETATDPLNPDSDDDGLRDGEETTSNPALADTDNDGAPDAWEIRTGFDPASNTSTPPVFSGAIGINFRSEASSEHGLWSDLAPNGFVPQIHWNQTELLRAWGVSDSEPLLNGDTNAIASPSENSLVNAAGATIATTINFVHDGCRSNHNKGSRAAELLQGGLSTDTNQSPRVTLSGIPFTNYDLYLYVSSAHLGPTGTARLNNDPATDITVRPISSAPTQSFITSHQSASPNVPLFNTIRFSGLSGSSQIVGLFEVDQNIGIAAIQVVDIDADSDGDSVPDYWEFQHGTDANTSNANSDPDGDGLNNVDEFARGTDPNNPDSDHDGLSDFVETNTGTYLNSNDTGSNPLYGDSDGDGLSDSAELAHAFPSNPNEIDSDSDGKNDDVELAEGSNPNNALNQVIPVPTFPAPNRLTWTVDNLQLVRNHETPLTSTDNNQQLVFSLGVINAAQPAWTNLDFRLVMANGKLGEYTVAQGDGGFRHVDGWDLWYGDLNTDLTAAFGFSGSGTFDASDPFSFHFTAEKNPDPNSNWSLSYVVTNEATNTIILSRTIENTVASTTIANQTATWRNQSGIANRCSVSTGQGITLYHQEASLETIPAFTLHRDSDDDGIPDWWENLHSLNPNNSNDAIFDSDNDQLNNLAEYRAGTFPDSADSDNDGVNDGEESYHFTHPSAPNSEPAYFKTGLAFNADRNGNNLPDIWEAAFRTSGLSASGDDDGDGSLNSEEALAGTDPLDATSKPSLEFRDSSSEPPAVFWPTIPGKEQTLLSSSSLVLPFEPELTSASYFEGGNTVQEVSTAAIRRFFRVTTTDQNSDSDPLNDWSELALGSSPVSANSTARPGRYDSNGDGEGESEIAGDLLTWQKTFANQEQLSTGGTVSTPTSYDAARLLMQGSFGPTIASIEEVRSMGLEAWIDDQIMGQPPTHHRDYVDEISQDFHGPRTDLTYSYNVGSDFIDGNNVQTAFARAAISGPDQLRQRVAFALSQILVISRRDANLAHNIYALSTYYDLLVEHAFGDYEELLLEVTLNPAMGRYLSHLGNQPADPSINRYPDENYAREVMQLFSIGLWELQPNGERKTDANGDFIPTYGNAEVTELARVMTGLWYGDQSYGYGGWQDTHYAIPMNLFPDHHDFGSKTLLNGFTIPARPPSEENGLLDIQDAIEHLVQHENCAPFICKSLIQFLVTSNPSPEYVARVSAVFADDGTGQRGNLGAVVKALLLDPEARDPVVANSATFGLLREPVIRTMHLARLTQLNRDQDLVWWDYNNYNDAAFQAPLFSPSVFNFYRPDYQPPQTLTDNGLLAPAFEITNSYSAVSFPNHLWQTIDDGFSHYEFYHVPPDYSLLRPYADDSEALLDYVNLVICSGHMTAKTRDLIRTGLNQLDASDHSGRMKLALYSALMSPQGAIQR